MTSLQGKRILLGVSGSIAAYKSAVLLRLLMKAGCEVRVIMTPSAKDFISPLTFSTLSRQPVATDVHNDEGWTNHVEWGLWADAMIIAPATAHTLARCALGLASDMLTATYLSARCPVFFAPAMDLDMWQHPATKSNLSKLQSYGNFILDVGEGELASGLIGPGRLAEPEEIRDYLADFFRIRQDFLGVRVLVNAGPTYEALDPVRYIGNHSTGKMGVAIADEIARRGGEVTLVLGPDSVLPENDQIIVHHITSADEMLEKCLDAFDDAQVTILAAAVADYKPASVSGEKIKKGDGPMHLELIRTPDIAETLGKRKKNNQLLVGFALETTNVRENAKDKMTRKQLDMIVLNNPKEAGAGFGHDTNKVSFLFPNNKEQVFELKSKKQVAFDIAEAIHKLLKHNA